MKQVKITPSITNREAQSVDKYLTEIGKVSLITADEEVVLAQKIRNGDQAALERLTRANLRFVVSVSKQFQNQGLPLSDLISEGNLGLIRAAKRFDETRGFKFISYAVWWIRQGIMQAIAEQARMVRLPLNQVGSLSRIGKTFSRLEQELERDPTVEEIADAMESTAEKIADSLSKAGRHVSVDAPFKKDEEGSLLDVLEVNQAETDDLLMQESLKAALGMSLQALSDREKQILVLFYGINLPDPLSLAEIADRLGITRERVRQLKDKALSQLRHHRHHQQLKGYL